MISTTSGKPARILIVDDHPIIRRGIRDLIESNPRFAVCGETGMASQVMQLITQTRPDVVIIDITLKDIDGIELVKQLRSRDGSLRMLVSSMHDETLYAERALRAGAQGYVSKSEPPLELLGAIQRVLEGRIYLSKRMSDYMLRRAASGEEQVDIRPVNQLSDRELEVYELIGRGLTTRQIAARLHRSIKTIETYRQHLKRKLKLKNSTELVRHAVKWQVEPQGRSETPSEPAPETTVGAPVESEVAETATGQGR